MVSFIRDASNRRKMLICHCKAQTEAVIKRCIAEGASTECEVGKRCGAGTACGGCLPLLRQLLDESDYSAPHSAA